MDEFEWNEAVQICFDNLDLDRHKLWRTKQCVKFAETSLLAKIGCDYTSILMDEFNPIEPKDSGSIKSLAIKMPNKISKLTQLEHETYLNYLKNNRNIPGFKKSHPLRKITAKFVAEQKEFANFAFQASMARLDLYDYVTQQTLDNVAKYLALAKERMNKYDQKYSYRDSIPISCIPFVTDPTPNCIHIATMQGGSYLHVPTCGKNIPNYKFSKESSNVQRKSLSEDSEILKFVSKWKPDIVICLSSLNTIASNLPPHKCEWEVPMVVKEYPDDAGGKRHITFIDKAFPSKSLNGREMNEIYFGKSVKQFVKHSKKKSEEVNVEINRTSVNVASSAVADSQKTSEIVDSTQDLSSNSNSDPDNRKENLLVVETSSVKPGNRSPSEFSHSSDEPITKQETNVDNTSSLFSKAPKNYSDSDLELVIDDAMSDTSIPQVDGSNDRKSKQPRKITRSTRVSVPHETEQTETIKEIASDTKIKEETNRSKSDIWQKSFSGEEKVTSFLSLPSKPKRPSISTLSMTLWKNKASEIKGVEAVHGIADENPLTLVTEDEEVKDNEEELNTSQESITYNASCDPVLESQIKAAVSSTRAEHNASPLLTPQKRIPTRSAAKVGKSPPPSAAKATRKRKRESRDTAKSKTIEGETKKQSRKAKKPRVERDKSDENEETYESSDDNISLSKLSQKLITGSTSPAKPRPTPKGKLPHARNVSSFPNPSAANLMTSKPVTAVRAKHPKVAKENLPNSETHVKATNDQSQKDTSVASDVLGQILGMQKTVNEVKAKVRKQSVATISEWQQAQKSHQDESLESDGRKSCFYSLWSFGEKRILIRGTHHGYLTIHNKKDPVKSHVAIRTKLEYQSELGFEQLTTRDACREWVDLYFRPQPIALLRCRVDPLNNKVVGTNVVKNVEALRTSFPTTGFNDFKAKKLLTETFNRLSNPIAYPTGSYLLSHKSGCSEFTVRKGNAPEKAVIYDLQREYATPGRRVFVTASTVPYIPLDPEKQLPAHVKIKRLPMTFEPAPNPAGEKSDVAKKKKNKGKKNKKSRRNRKSIECDA